MKCLIITVAGMSSRFSQSVGTETIKCIYHVDSIEKSILYRLINNDFDYFDKIIIVGGYKFSELETAIQTEFFEFANKIELVYNDHFQDYGSGYSLLLGLEKGFDLESDEIVFAEGDLYVPQQDFVNVAECNLDVITSNMEAIEASKSVVFYRDTELVIHYVFDTNHGELCIDEPFVSIRNSGQIWKFKDISRLQALCQNLSMEEMRGTNLIIVQKYFSGLEKNEIREYQFRYWLNCNTVDDYRLIEKMEAMSENNK